MIKMKFGLILIMLAFASENEENKVESTKSQERIKEKNDENLILVKIEEDEYTKSKKKTSSYIGVSYDESKTRWIAQRWSKKGNKNAYNGTYSDEETAARASDTLARKLMENGEQNHKLNFPDDDTEVYPEEKKTSSNYIGVSYESKAKWRARRRSKKQNKMVQNGHYKNEETAAHASDTLARKLMDNGEQNHKLNFPYDDTEVYPETKRSSKYIGVTYNKHHKKWIAQRWSKNENTIVHEGYHKDEETAAHASDNLARELMAIGEQNHKLNFPDDDTEVNPEDLEYRRNKRKRSDNEDLGHFYNK